MSSYNLGGNVAFVTGATGILGRRYVEALCREGAHVIITDLDESACENFATEVSTQTGTDCLGLRVDVSNPDSVQAAVDTAIARFGRIDILINNAASKGDEIQKLFQSTVDYELKVWRSIMSVNIDGQFIVAQSIGRFMIGAGKGRIINVSSIYGCVGPDQRIYEGSEYMGVQINTPLVYSVSKAAVHGLTRHLATEWGVSGIRVNTLTPGGVESGQNDIFVSRYSDRTPMGRMARGEEMVGAMLFLASDASSYVTGQNIIVDGGWTAW